MVLTYPDEDRFRYFGLQSRTDLQKTKRPYNPHDRVVQFLPIYVSQTRLLAF
jgi:hypothetical protein